MSPAEAGAMRTGVMILRLIIGGAYQGKRAFAEERFGLKPADIVTCTGEAPDFSGKCLDRLEEYTLACVRAGRDSTAVFRENRGCWEDAVLILGDISAGVVPMDREMRAWREENGRLGRYLAEQAESVHRIFCGLEQRLK